MPPFTWFASPTNGFGRPGGAMKQGLSLRVSQHLALTPQLQQSIRLLQLSTLELSQEVGQMLDENPFLELNQDEVPREEFGLPQADTPVRDEDLDSERAFTAASDFVSESRVSERAESEDAAQDNSAEPSWDGDGSTEIAPDDNEWGGDAPARQNNVQGDDAASATELARNQESLSAFLQRQALSLRLSEIDRAALRFLIESLNDDGYLEDSLASLAQGLAGSDLEQCEELEQRFSVALKLLQSLEPVGVGARDLGECLRLQLRALPGASSEEQQLRDAALHICEQPMELLARRDVRRLVQLCGETDTVIRAALTLITRLEPKPGRRFVDVERNVIVPDVIVVRVAGPGQPKFRVQLNAEVMPRLRVHDIYANALKQHRGGGNDAANHAALAQRLQEARWFIKNIQQRFDTILRVSNAIVERQKSFFVHGELAMRPLVLREIADELGLHESTISRVTTAKYMATPFGTFELKYFFGSGLGTETGGNASSTAVRALIKQFVAAENIKKPLSDSQMSEMLKEQGIDCARRTVAKYREALKIAPTNLRRALQ
jgi:RNA polymerase sigma-54 factor